MRTIVLLAIVLLIVVPWWLTFQPVPTRTSVGPRVFPAKLEAHVRLLASEPHGSQHVERLDALAAHLTAAFAASGARVTEQTFVPMHATATYRNVIASFGPTSDEVVVVGAHYDAFESGPGADGVTGVAALVELAELLAQAKLRVGVELVAYSLGEAPYFGTTDMGSAHHARAMRDQKRQVRAMLSLEGLGVYSTLDGSQRYASWPLRLLYPKKADFLSIVGRYTDHRLVRDVKRAMGGATDVPVWSFCGTKRFGVDASDHQSYWANGFPAVMITDTGAARNPRRRTAADTSDTLDYARFAKSVSALHNALVVLAD